ncbi:MAG: methylenetetrahydrofolate reductase, partial [Gammaproteobacteria bacterium]|nr:methylenetetrahydrofolate reductase [Gammaproteobacteria bacterium]
MQKQQHNKTVSVEFFPPKTEQGMQNLRSARTELAEKLKPNFYSVTFGAGGSTQARTLETVLEIQQNGLQAAPHISCVGANKSQLLETLQHYQKAGIRHLVALRGDLPSGTHGYGDFQYANELVEFIRAETGDHFFIEVAAYPETHPQALNSERDLLNFKRKVDAGANSAITQYFYNADAYFHFVERCEKIGIHVPIVPGIMPITNYSSLARFSAACGAEIPRWMSQQLQTYGDDSDSIRNFG